MNPSWIQALFGVPVIEQVPGYAIAITVYTAVKWIFITADVALFMGFVYALVKGWAYRPHIELHPHDDGHHKASAKPHTLQTDLVKQRWQSIVRRTAGDSPDSLRIAVIEADSLVNDFLKQVGYEGEHMADRLSSLDPEEVTTLPRLWHAHRVRNDLVHTPGFYLDPGEAKDMLGTYEDFLKELGAFG
jgi:hypothetical protein